MNTLLEIGGSEAVDLYGLSDSVGGNHAILIDNSVVQTPVFSETISRRRPSMELSLNRIG